MSWSCIKKDARCAASKLLLLAWRGGRVPAQHNLNGRFGRRRRLLVLSQCPSQAPGRLFLWLPLLLRVAASIWGGSGKKHEALLLSSAVLGLGAWLLVSIMVNYSLAIAVKCKPRSLIHLAFCC